MPLECRALLQRANSAETIARPTDALLPAIAALPLERKSCVKLIRNGARDETAGLHAIEASVGGVQSELGRFRWFCRNVINCAAGCVLSKEGSLRPLQDFHALQIKACQRRHRGVRQRGFVHVHGDRGGTTQIAVEETDAAERERLRMKGTLLDGEARNNLR